MLAIWSLILLPFSKTSLNIRKFTVHILLKPGLENFEHYFTSVRWVQLCGRLSILWHCLSLGLEWKRTFSSPVASDEFPKFAGILSAALLQHLPSVFPRLGSFPMRRLFTSDWSKCGSFSFSISPSNDWFDLPEVQGILKSLLQHHHSKSSIIQCSVFLMDQLSHPYMTPG